MTRAGRRFKAARDGDKRQARRRVNHLVAVGVLPKPSAVACVDCEHIGDDVAHEYDHHLGYFAEHHVHVQAVCKPCHAARTAGYAAPAATNKPSQPLMRKRRRDPHCGICGQIGHNAQTCDGIPTAPPTPCETEVKP